MRDFAFCVQLPDGREACVAPISRDAFEANRAYDLGDDFGYFIYEYDPASPSAGIQVLGKAASYDAAVRLVEIYTIAANNQVNSTTTVSRSPKPVEPEFAI